MNGAQLQPENEGQDRPWIDTQGLQNKAINLFLLEVITPAEYKTLLKQLWSPDYENHVVADEIINNKIKSM